MPKPASKKKASSKRSVASPTTKLQEPRLGATTATSTMPTVLEPKKAPGETRLGFRATPTLIPTEKEHGLSYRAEIIATINDSIGELVIKPAELSDDLNTLLSSNPEGLPIFVKCPPDGLHEKAEDHLKAEYENSKQLNYAADRLAYYSDSKKKQGSVGLLQISKLLGKGTLTLSGEPKRHCLIYESIPGNDLAKSPLPQLGTEAVKAKTETKNFLHFALDLATAVLKLHNQGVVHSFIVPRHLVRTQTTTSESIPKVCLVGFGYTRLCDSRGKAGAALAVVERDQLFRAPECRDTLPHSAFWFPADIYSIGAILYHWLAREYDAKGVAKDDGLDVLKPKNLPRDVRRLKKEIAETLRKRVPVIVRENENILKILDSCLRYRAEDRYSCVEELIESIKIAITAGDGEHDSTTNNGSDNASNSSSKIAQWVPEGASESKELPLPPYFTNLKETLTSALEADFTAIMSGHYEVYGHRDKIVTSLCRLLASARPGDTYATMTLPDYWTDDNLGSDGRFLVMNKHMVRTGVNIKRLYLVSRAFHELSEGEQYILEQQLAAEEEIAAEVNLQAKEPGTTSVATYGDMSISVLEVDEQTVADFEKEGSMVAYLQKKLKTPTAKALDEDFVCLNFFSNASISWMNGKEIVKRRIHKVRYWKLDKKRRERFEENRTKFENHVKDAKTLKSYISKAETEFGLEELAVLIDS